jgi:hypothetical protein
MESFYICHCGYRENNHEFKHSFEKVCKVVRTNKNGEKFVLDADNFKINSKYICNIENCNGKKELHNSLINHSFEPKEYKYRNINFILPNNAICNYINMKNEKCNINIEKHNEIITHKFKTNIVILNKLKSDIIKIEDPFDYEMIIDYH